jgi:hypothetical protein
MLKNRGMFNIYLATVVINDLDINFNKAQDSTSV